MRIQIKDLVRVKELPCHLVRAKGTFQWAAQFKAGQTWSFALMRSALSDETNSNFVDPSPPSTTDRREWTAKV
jgi:hypothetical protein